MLPIELLKEASRRVHDAVSGMAGTADAAGDFGRGAGGDISRNIDITAEKTVLDFIKESNFGCTVLGEECGRVEFPGKPGGYIIMDAIDGSANAVRGVPIFCCSLAYATDEKLSSITDGVVMDLSRGDMYWATKGGGAHLNEKDIHVRLEDPIYRIVGVNTSGATIEQLSKMKPLFDSPNHTRHFGANALEMAFLSSGLLDVFVDLRGKIRIQDIAAGYLLIKESGGIILDENLKELDSDLEYSTRLSFLAASIRKMLDDVTSGIV